MNRHAHLAHVSRWSHDRHVRAYVRMSMAAKPRLEGASCRVDGIAYVVRTHAPPD